MKQNPHILVVDDEQTNTILFTELLRKAGYSVTTAQDGFKAIAACKVRTPDLILLDLRMPLMSGPDVVERLKRDEKTRDIPVIFLVTSQELPATGHAQEHGEQEYLTKPPDPTELMVRVRSALRVKFLKDEIRKKEGQIRELSLVDPVTSLRNTRFLNEFLKAEIAQARRYSVPLSLVILDLDRQKELLRAHGQKVIDSLVTQVAAVLTRSSRQSDVLARTGAFEFTIVLPHTEREGAAEVAERMRNVIAQSTFTIGNSVGTITVSIGLCQFSADMDDEGKTLLSHARAALAQAHASGGNVTLMAQ
ncbi:MAG TPA: diguanylate cyclase [Candidatus Obscuribacterales bacterium]